MGKRGFRTWLIVSHVQIKRNDDMTERHGDFIIFRNISTFRNDGVIATEHFVRNAC